MRERINYPLDVPELGRHVRSPHRGVNHMTLREPEGKPDPHATPGDAERHDADIPPADQANDVHSVPGENEIGALLDDAAKRINHNQRWALREWIEAAKLLVIMADVHKYQGERYTTFALAHLPIKNARDAHSLYLLGFRGDDVLAECEAAARLSSSYEWPSWRMVVGRLRREAKRKEMGDGAAPTDEDQAKLAEIQTALEELNKPSEEIIRKDARIHELEAQLANIAESLDTTRQTFRSERVIWEERVDKLRDISHLFAEASEKGLWDRVTLEPPPTHPTSPEPPDAPPEPPDEPSEQRGTGALIVLSPKLSRDEGCQLIGGMAAPSCEQVREIIERMDWRNFRKEDFRHFTVTIGDWTQAEEDYPDLVYDLMRFTTSEAIFCDERALLFHEAGELLIRTWEQLDERIAQIEAAKRKPPAKRKRETVKPLPDAPLTTTRTRG